MELLQKIERYKASTIEEAERFVEEEKKDPRYEGYEVKSYKLVKKEKKSKGEILESWINVEITKVWND